MLNKNAADRLIDKIKQKNNPSVIGLDPQLEYFPEFLKTKAKNNKTTANVILEFNKAIINSIADIVPAIKPQIAFYEQYGSDGIKALEKTLAYARKKNLIIIMDAKRGDIGSTAQSYADAYLANSPLSADFLTVNPYLGKDTLEPFIKNCKKYNKGLFILVKTSNPGSGDFQNQVLKNNKKLYEEIADYVKEVGHELIGENNYSPIGAVVGATYPEQAKKLRNLMPNSLFLVPGYGAQGGSAKDVLSCFNQNGLGAIVNSSRKILYAYQDKVYQKKFSPKQFAKASRQAALDMRDDIGQALNKKIKIISEKLFLF